MKAQSPTLNGFNLVIIELLSIVILLVLSEREKGVPELYINIPLCKRKKIQSNDVFLQ